MCRCRLGVQAFLIGTEDSGLYPGGDVQASNAICKVLKYVKCLYRAGRYDTGAIVPQCPCGPAA